MHLIFDAIGDLLKVLLSAVLLFWTFPALAFEEKPLKESAGPNRTISCALRSTADDDAAYVRANALIAHHCDTLVSENGMKLHHLIEQPKSRTETADDKSVCDGHSLPPFNLTEAGKAWDFAYRQEPDMLVHYHAVIWPGKSDDADCILSDPKLLDEYLIWVAKRVDQKRQHIASIDLFNEIFVKFSPLTENGNKDPWLALSTDREDYSHPDIFGQLFHPSIPGTTPEGQIQWLVEVVDALRAKLDCAERACPPLLLNEDLLSAPYKRSARKRQAILGLLHVLEDAGAKLDGVGLQAHLSAKDGIDADGLSKFATDLGESYELHVSELDMSSISYLADSAGELEKVHAKHVGDFLEALLPHANVVRLGFWGLSDGQHVSRSEFSPPGIKDPTSTATLYNDELETKYVFEFVEQKLVAHRLNPQKVQR